MARPKIDPEARKGRLVVLRLKPAEYAAYKTAADRAGKTLSAWLRDVADGDSVRTETIESKDVANGKT